MKTRTRLKNKLAICETGYCLPAVWLSTFSLMDEKGNLREKPEPRRENAGRHQLRVAA